MRPLITLWCALFSVLALADVDSPVPTPVPSVSPVAPVITILPPAPSVKPVPMPSGTPSGPTVQVATPAAPPTWAQDLIVTAEKLPVVGPFLSKALIYIGIISSILTVLVGTVLAILNSVMGVFNASGLTEAAAAIVKFRDGPIMYWLKFFSLFNAKKIEPPQPTVNA